MQHLPVPTPPAGTIDVWPVELTDGPSADIELLGGEERERAARRRGEERRRFVASHAALRHVVAAYGRTPACASSVVASYGQAPRARCGLRLSLAHCGDLALIGVASSAVGVDLESVGVAADAVHLTDLAEMTLHGRELEQLRATHPTLRSSLWIRLFVRKEACLKAHGQGLSDVGLAEVDVLDDDTTQRSLRDVAIDAGHVAAVALRRPITAVRRRELTA